MIELKRDTLHFSFPDVHGDALLSVQFQRTLRIPDDDRVYPLPPGLGAFPLRHVDDYREAVSEEWARHGGVFLPMYQSEALWIHFSSEYPFAVKVATGKIDAVTGDEWSDGIHRSPQDYVTTPDQPWLDGYCVEEGVIRQFVAMPLGSGYSVEEQVTGEAQHGGIQIVAYPLKAKFYRPRRDFPGDICYSAGALEELTMVRDMGLAPGGKMRQEIYQDGRKLSQWDTDHRSRCFVHIANSLGWREITGEDPPPTPVSAKEYAKWGMPWFDYYGGDKKALGGAPTLERLKSVFQLGKEKGAVPLHENETVKPEEVIPLGPGALGQQVREGDF